MPGKESEVLAAIGIPSIPGLLCPPAAGALGAAGLGPVCQAAGGVAGAAAGQIAGFGVSSVLDAIAGWVSAGAVWLLAQIGGFLDATTSIDLGATWFTTHYQTMAGLAGVVIVPMLLFGVIQAVHRQSASMLVRSVAINVPLAILLTAVAVKLVQLGLALTDSMSATVARGAGVDTGHFFGSTVAALSVGATATGDPATAPTFVVLMGGLAVVFGAFVLWVELLIRAAAVYVAVLFLPLALASLAWPAIAHWCRRLVDTLVALVLAKFVIVSVLSLAAGALAGASGSSPAGSAGGSHGGFTAVLGGAALLMLAAFAPWALFRLLPFLESGAVGHLEGVGHKTHQLAAVPPKSLAQHAMRVSSDSATGGASEVGMALASAAAGAAGGAVGASGGGGADGGDQGAGGSGSSGSPGPDLGPSSLQKDGLGAATAPGASVPTRTPHPDAGRVYREVNEEEGPDGAPSGEPALPALAASRPGTEVDRPPISKP